MTLNVCAVTSNRADWGLLSPLLSLIRDDAAFVLKIVATGQHLSASAGATANDIIADGFAIDETIDMKLKGDTATDVTSGLAVALNGFGKSYADLRPDLLILLGDRYEILGAAIAATLARIPIAHLCGGDITEGATDDAFRHAITKMSHLHFVTSQAAAQRVAQLGEDPARIFNVGSTGLDRIRTVGLLDRGAFFNAIKLGPRSRNVMITFHPETLAANTVNDCAEMLAALDMLGPDVGLLFSGSNSDVAGLAVGTLIQAFVQTHTNAVLHPSLGSVKYFSALKHCDMVVGNSSSGLYEAPSFGIPTINIGDRQKGRERATSVIDVKAKRDDIFAAIQQGFALDCRHTKNPYGDGNSAARITQQIKSIADPQKLLIKKFIVWPRA